MASADLLSGKSRPLRRLLVAALFAQARLRSRLGLGPTLWIVGGPSSAGKTTFIKSGAFEVVTGLPKNTPVVRPGRARDKLVLLLTSDVIVHYNLLRPVLWAQNQQDPVVDSLDFYANDSVWRLLVKLPVNKRAAIVHADDETVLGRVRDRRTREPWSELPYDGSKFDSAYAKWPPSTLYAAWRKELTRVGIPATEVDSLTHAIRHSDT